MTANGFEVVNAGVRRGPFRAAVFDVDGTLSLFREGWVDIMVGYAVGVLAPHGVADPDAVRDWVLALNGRPTVHQMDRLAAEVAARGGPRPDPRELLDEYLGRLMVVVGGRRAGVAGGTAAATDWAVSGAHALLENLRDRGVALYAASGSDLAHVAAEIDLLGLRPFFGRHVYAPADNTPAFSKADVIARVLAEHGIPGGQLLGFGDGVVETREVKRAGGVAVGVASVGHGETGSAGWKRGPLVAAGADVIVPDYRGHERLVAWLFGAG